MTVSAPATAGAAQRPLVVASQLPAPWNAALAARADVALLPLAPGVPTQWPAEAEVLLATPFKVDGSAWTEPPPAGWPGRLRWVQLASSGIDFYPPWLFEAPLVSSARGTASDAIAEYVLAAVIGAVRDQPAPWVHDAAAWRERGRRVAPRRLAGQVLGLYGFGSIGRAVATRALALGLRVVALRRTAAPFGLDGVEAAADLAALAAVSDHLVLAAPATAATRGAVDAAVLAAAKPGLHLVNIARGALIDDAALLAALDRGQVALATLDVTEPEPLPDGHPYWQHPQVRLSPHVAPMSPAIGDALVAKFLDNLARWRGDEPLADVVDAARGY